MKIKFTYISAIFILIFASQLLVAQNKVLQLDGIDDYLEIEARPFENLKNTTIEGWFWWDEFRYFS